MASFHINEMIQIYRKREDNILGRYYERFKELVPGRLLLHKLIKRE